MTITTYTNLLQEPQLVSKSQTDDLKTIVDTFPYFQSARALYLKGLKNADSFKYNQALKTTAAYTTDRSILFDFITSKEFKQDEVSKHIKKNTADLLDITVSTEDISINKSVTIDDALKQEVEATKSTLNANILQPKIEVKDIANFNDVTNTVDTVTNKATTKLTEDSQPSPETILNIGKPLDFGEQETHSFNEWLGLTRLKPINRSAKPSPEPAKTEAEKESNLKKAKKFELIEKFIENSPKLEAKKATVSKHNIAKAQMIKPEALMTETLARIYVEQKNYKKAIQSYRILSLKYPEKSGYFADQIKAIKQLQEYNNKE